MTDHDDLDEGRSEDSIRAELTAAAVSGEISEHERQRPTPVQRAQRILHRYPALGPLVVLLLMLVAFSFMSDRFLQPFNMSLIIQQVTVVGTLAIGQTIIILTAGIDLSVGAIAVFVSVIMAKLSADYGVPGIGAILVGLAAGTGAGLVNGLLITRLRLPPFIVTLGTLSIFFALNLYVSASTTIRGRDMDPILTALAGRGGTVEVPFINTPIPYASLGMIAMYVVMAYVLRYTAWGRHIYATGDDPESSRLTGIKVDRVLVSVYAVAGFIYAVGAWFLIGRVGAASPQVGTTYNLDTITAVVIGGTSLFGGRGVVIGTLIGAVIVGMARNGLSLAGFDPLWQDFTVGALVIVAVTLDQWIRRVSA
ncbi:MAG: ABC transporter permease [Chloroflexota bacterium]|jgi:fructose transport system permease protein